MIALSCFDGMSCGQLAFERAGIPIEKYYASEIDKYAIQVTMANYPDTIQLGSITEWQSWNIEKPDIIIGGSPCQGFSFAGKQLNFEDERSKLFFVFVDILKHYKPKYFLLENVIMKKEYNDVISSILGDMYPECVTQCELFRTGRLEPIQINSALVSAQNRNRLYWTNIPGVTQPEDKGILLKDIIEKNTDEYILTNDKIEKIRKWKSQQNPIVNAITINDKTPCITARGAGEYHSGMILVTGDAFRGRNPGNPSDRTPGAPTEQRLEINQTGKSNALTSVSKDNVLCYTDNYIQYCNSGKNHNSMPYRIYHKNRKGPCLSKSNERYQLKEDETDTEILWRKLTPIECERLQTVPDNYTNHVSNSQRYKMLGNGWTIDVISHIFRGLK